MKSDVESDTGTNASGASEEMENLHASFAQLRKDVMELLGHAFGLGREGADMAKDGRAHAVDNLKERIAGLKDRGSEGVEAIEDRIEENPLRAVLMAFGIGFLLAKIFSRK